MEPIFQTVKELGFLAPPLGELSCDSMTERAFLIFAKQISAFWGFSLKIPNPLRPGCAGPPLPKGEARAFLTDVGDPMPTASGGSSRAPTPTERIRYPTAKNSPRTKVRGLFSLYSAVCPKTSFPIQFVGASIARPPKNIVFRISRREISIFFALRRQILTGQNLRTTNGRPYTVFHTSASAF